MANDIVLVSQKLCDQTEDVQSILLSGIIARKSKYGLISKIIIVRNSRCYRSDSVTEKLKFVSLFYENSQTDFY